MLKKFIQSDALRTITTLVVLVVMWGAWKADLLGTTGEELIDKGVASSLNAAAVEEMTQNYYEVLTDVDRGDWGSLRYFRAFIMRTLGVEDESDAAENWVPIGRSGATRNRTGYLGNELLPNVEVMFKGATLKTNRWGQRDIDYEKQKPDNTFRIALVGGSNSMGSGVELEYTYQQVCETLLNEKLAGTKYDHYEIMNFSVGGYQLMERLFVINEKVQEFEPDLILCVVTMHDLRWAVHERVAYLLENDHDLIFPRLIEAVTAAGVTDDDSDAKIKQRLRRYRASLVSGIFQELKELGERFDIPMATLILRIRVLQQHDSLEKQALLSEEVGLPTLRVTEAYEGRTEEEMYLRPSDHHPTILGHRLLGEELYQRLIEHPSIAPLLTDPPQSP